MRHASERRMAWTEYASLLMSQFGEVHLNTEQNDILHDAREGVRMAGREKAGIMAMEFLDAMTLPNESSAWLVDSNIIAGMCGGQAENALMSPPPPELRRSTPLRIVIVTDSTIYRKRDNETSVQALLQPFGIELSKGSDRGLELPDLARVAESWINSTSADKAIETVVWMQYSGNDFNQASWETKKNVVCNAIVQLRTLRAKVLDIVFLCPKSKEALDSYGMTMSQ